jgi:hypothetical protein
MRPIFYCPQCKKTFSRVRGQKSKKCECGAQMIVAVADEKTKKVLERLED